MLFVASYIVLIVALSLDAGLPREMIMLLQSAVYSIAYTSTQSLARSASTSHIWNGRLKCASTIDKVIGEVAALGVSALWHGKLRAAVRFRSQNQCN